MKSYIVCLIWGLIMLAGGSLHAQPALRIDSLPTDGLSLRSGWRWHPGDDQLWASPAFNDSRWDTIRPARSISRQPDLQKEGRGWLRLTFILDSPVAQVPLAFLVNQVGASEMYLDGKPFLRLGKVGDTYQREQAYSPNASDSYLLPNLSAGRHVLAVRLSQHRSPWYVPKFLYFTQSVFELTLIRADNLTSQIANQVYIQTLGNYALVGIFFMLAVIHFLYYYYRRKWVNLVFCLTMVLGTGCVILIELIGLTNSLSIREWLFLGQGLFVTLFMLFLLVTYYVYLGQSITWQLWVVAVLLVVPRLIVDFIKPGIVFNIGSITGIIALFADGVRISIEAIRAKRANARFMLTSILVMLLILLVGGLVSWWLSDLNPTYGGYSNAITNMLFFLTLPMSFAIILAREHAQTNRNLEDRLTEVAELSREKEILLTRQNETLERQVTERTAELTRSLTDLRDTQQQLIQREKMASLGELTAGIAHEIQNPLNFVNNFADVSGELLQELKEELEKDSRDEELETEILADLAQNLQKISHHGGRASSIVRSMLDHSRTSTGQSEPTDLNALVDEYLRLSYHGLRAKDKNFNATLNTHFDPSAGTVTVVAQDVGRVLLNLFNNAFYALQERQSTAPSTYKPTLSVSTQHVGNAVEIRVSDNGPGVPRAIQEKIFQPFFTTKPTGQGTGLGLSLSYDIITKGHGGVFTLETNSDEGATFLIRLPDHSSVRI